MRQGAGVDVVLDLHDLQVMDAAVGTALMIDTLEHVEYPHRAMAEVHRVLAEDGVVFMTSVMRFPIHDHPHDYWRFTPDAFRSLLKDFTFSWADFAGEPDLPHTVVGLGSKRAIAPDALSAFLERFEEWKRWARASTWPEWLTAHPQGVPMDPMADERPGRLAPRLARAARRSMRRGS
jgi:SAM-dependent methyltransferase